MYFPNSMKVINRPTTQLPQVTDMVWLNQLPSLMFTIISKERSAEINMEIELQHHLTELEGDIMMQVIKNIITKKITPSRLNTTIIKDIKLDESKAKQLALDLLGRRFLPMQWYIGNVEGLIKDLGGDVAKYEAEARKNYPEVYAPDATTQVSETANVTAVPSQSKTTSTTDEPAILRDIAEKLATPKGRATVLLRLTALSLQIEEAGKSGQLTADETTKLLYGLDALSYSVNTQDLNPLEIGAIKRRLKNILAKVKA